jgi:hypothetical protein
MQFADAECRPHAGYDRTRFSLSNAAASRLSAMTIAVTVSFALLATWRASFIFRMCLQILPRVMVDISVLVPIFALFQVLLAVLAAVLTTILLPVIALPVPAAAVLIFH